MRINHLLAVGSVALCGAAVAPAGFGVAFHYDSGPRYASYPSYYGGCGDVAVYDRYPVYERRYVRSYSPRVYSYSRYPSYRPSYRYYDGHKRYGYRSHAYRYGRPSYYGYRR